MGLANIKSAIKRAKTAKVKTLQNSMVKSAVKTAVKRFEEDLGAGDSTKLQDAFSKAAKTIDKACAKGILKKNTAARRKSKIARMINTKKAQS